MAPSAIDAQAFALPPNKRPPERVYPPARIFPVQEVKFEAAIPIQQDGKKKAFAQPDSAAIVIDAGSHNVRAGWSFEQSPRLSIPAIMAKYRDRKLGKTYSFAGTDCYADTTARSHIRTAFEAGTGVITSWDAMEHVLDYIFIKLGMNEGDDFINMPIVMTEAVANLPYSRKTMTEIIFECYRAPSLAYGIDSLFSYKYNKGKTGLVVSSGYTSTHVIPVYNSKAMLGQATRLNWGGYHAADYLMKLIRLKYPSFNAKTNISQFEHMVREYCYLSTDYSHEIKNYLDWTGLEDRDVVIQYPYTEEVVVQKSQEELDKAAEKKRLNGVRLQEQAAKMRLEKLMQKEKQLERYKKVQDKLPDLNKKETRRILDDNDVKDEAVLDRTIKELEKAVRKGRMKDVGGDEEEQGEPVFDLLDVPDDQLDDAGLRNKRQQKLSKASHDARQRAKAEKEADRARAAEEKRLDEERRETDLPSWLGERHRALADTMARMRDKERLRQDLGNRKSLASQIRMKSIANLASDHPTKKRRRGGDDDDFGANDDDWGVYRDIAVDPASEDEEEDLPARLAELERDLLRYDDDFTYEQTTAARSDWSRSLLHAFERGARPFDAGSAAENNQVHLNVERVRVAEVVFQPHMAGVDQAGVVEIAGDILTQRLPAALGGGGGAAAGRDEFLKDIFLTGGNTLFRHFDDRLRDGLLPLLPAGSPLVIRRAGDAVLDAWRGAAQWAGGSGWKAAAVTRAEYEEKGAEYFKEHDLGNAFV